MSSSSPTSSFHALIIAASAAPADANGRRNTTRDSSCAKCRSDQIHVRASSRGPDPRAEPLGGADQRPNLVPGDLPLLGLRSPSLELLHVQVVEPCFVDARPDSVGARISFPSCALHSWCQPLPGFRVLRRRVPRARRYPRLVPADGSGVPLRGPLLSDPGYQHGWYLRKAGAEPGSTEWLKGPGPIERVRDELRAHLPGGGDARRARPRARIRRHVERARTVPSPMPAFAYAVAEATERVACCRADLRHRVRCGSGDGLAVRRGPGDGGRRLIGGRQRGGPRATVLPSSPAARWGVKRHSKLTPRRHRKLTPKKGRK